MFKNTKPHVLYLHGYDESLSSEKRTILERYFTQTAPHVEFKSKSYLSTIINDYVEQSNFDAFIGNLSGGNLCFDLQHRYPKPVLVFNPPLAHPAIPLHFKPPEGYKPFNNYFCAVLGAKSELIDATFMRNFMVNYFEPEKDLQINWYSQLANHIVEVTFESEIGSFYFKIASKIERN